MSEAIVGRWYHNEASDPEPEYGAIIECEVAGQALLSVGYVTRPRKLWVEGVDGVIADEHTIRRWRIVAPPSAEWLKAAEQERRAADESEVPPPSDITAQQARFFAESGSYLTLYRTIERQIRAVASIAGRRKLRYPKSAKDDSLEYDHCAARFRANGFTVTDEMSALLIEW